MKEIKLSQSGKNKILNLVALVDDADFEYLNQWKWFAQKVKYTFYAAREEKGKYIYMHRLLLGISDRSIEVDHVDRNGWNNQMNNIRLATRRQNASNLGKQKNCISEFKGVCWNKPIKKWVAYIWQEKYLHLGCFLNEQDAARRYNEKAKELFGEFASLNEVS